MAPRTILIAGGGTGGHLMPALALAGELEGRGGAYRPVLVGAERGVERTVLAGTSFRYHLLPTEPLYRREWWKNARWLRVAFRLWRRTGRLLAEDRPAVVVGTGGYASVPVVWLAARRGIPTAIQEQNAQPGLATRWLSRRARHVYLGVPEARARLRLGPETEVFDTGNPISPPTPERRRDALQRFGVGGDRPVVLVTGGSQGARALNEAVAGWIEHGGAQGVTLLWVTGRTTYARYAGRHAPPGVQVIDFLDPMADGYAVADLVIGRAGMMTVAELCAWGLPSILVPLPTSAADHQTHNAQAMAAAGAARLLRQRDLTSRSLGEEVAALLRDPVARGHLAQAALARGRPDAAARIVSSILTLAGWGGLSQLKE